MSIQNHLNVFFNSTWEPQQISVDNGVIRIRINDSTLANGMLSLGHWCFSPIRYIFEGQRVTIGQGENNTILMNSQQEYDGRYWDVYYFAISILLLVPGAIMGTVFKGLDYLGSATIRENHHLIVGYFTPAPEEPTILAEPQNIPRPSTFNSNLRNIGSREEPLSRNVLMQVIRSFIDEAKDQKIENLVIYAENGLEIDETGIVTRAAPDHELYVNAENCDLSTIANKIILVGAHFVNGGGNDLSNVNNSEDWLDHRCICWSTAVEQPVDGMTFLASNLPALLEATLVQYRVASVDEALNDVPPNNLATGRPYKQIYIVI